MSSPASRRQLSSRAGGRSATSTTFQQDRFGFEPSPRLRRTSLSDAIAASATYHQNTTTGTLVASPTASQRFATGTVSTTGWKSSTQRRYGGASVRQAETNVVREQERILGVNTRVDHTRSSVISERTLQHTVKVPKKVIREDVVERIVVIPETIRREDIEEETQIIEERIVEVAKPIIQETVVEVPEITYVDKIVEVPEIVVQERIREVPRMQVEERVHEVPKIIHQEKVVEIPEIEYREIVIPRQVEVPEIREQIVTKEVPIPQFVDKPTPEYVDVDEYYEVERRIPVPVEAISTFEYQLPPFKSRVARVEYPLYVPRFIEVPIAEELLTADFKAQARSHAARVALLGQMTEAVSLCEVENLATQTQKLEEIKDRELRIADIKGALTQAWLQGTVEIVGETREERKFRMSRHLGIRNPEIVTYRRNSFDF